MSSRTATAERASSSSKVFELLAQELQEHIQTKVDEEDVERIVDARIEKARLPRPIEIRTGDTVVATLKDRTHVQFDALIQLVNEGHRNLLMVGPAGSGKTTLAKSMAKALDLEFGFLSLSAGISETHLFGRTLPQADGSWQYRPSRFVEVYEKGGVFLLDELDAADANVMVAINAALANGYLANPNGQLHERHEKTFIMGAANTWGRGGDHQYVGRNQLDAATLDRFVLATLRVDYDAALEEDLAKSTLDESQADELLGWIKDLREKITTHRIRRIASTRLVVGSIAGLKAGRDLTEIKARYFQDWSADEKAKVSA
jgi:cobaltochelatase CobS